jgi:hypothetical protein
MELGGRRHRPSAGRRCLAWLTPNDDAFTSRKASSPTGSKSASAATTESEGAGATSTGCIRSRAASWTCPRRRRRYGSISMPRASHCRDHLATHVRTGGHCIAAPACPGALQGGAKLATVGVRAIARRVAPLSAPVARGLRRCAAGGDACRPRILRSRIPRAALEGSGSAAHSPPTGKERGRCSQVRVTGRGCSDRRGVVRSLGWCWRCWRSRRRPPPSPIELGR